MDNILLTAVLIIIMTGYVVLESRQTDLSFPFSNKSHINCDTNRRITVNNVSVLDDVHCWIDDISDIKNSCDGRNSCSFRTNSTSDCLVQYGYFNISYICRGANYDCDFESGFCGWSQDISDDFDWTIQKANASLSVPVPYTDHTTGSQFGHLLHSGKSTSNKKARLISNIYVSNNVLCLTFWYQMHGTWPGILYVYQQIGNQLGTAIDKISSGTGYIWVRKDIQLKYVPSFRIVFESIQGYSDSRSIAVDDVYIRDGNCSGSQFDCTFEDNRMCGWNIEPEDLAWVNVRSSTSEHYPYYDHTKGSGDGRYLRGTVYTPQIKGKTRFLRNVSLFTLNTCLAFWYNIYLNDSGTLRVALRFNGTYTTLWETSTSTSSQWYPANIDINSSQLNAPTFIVIECASQNAFNIFAIDDVSMRTGKCSGDEKHERFYSSTSDVLLIDDCPKQLLDTGNFSFSYYPKYNECKDLYKQAQVMAIESCVSFNVTDPEYCNISLSAIKDVNRQCFMLMKNISVNYTCEVSESNSMGELKQEDIFQVIGIGVGSGVALLAIIICITVCFVKRRTRLVNKKKKKTKKPKQGSDVNGATSESVNDEDVEVVYFNEQYREEGNSNLIKMSNLMDGMDNPVHFNTTKESSNDIVYYNLDAKVMNKISNKSKQDIHRTEKEKTTDFNSDNNEDEYDRTNSIRLKREEHNMYSHAVEDVYDSASQTRNPTHEEDVSYDHFVGGTSESNYSVVHKKPKK